MGGHGGNTPWRPRADWTQDRIDGCSMIAPLASSVPRTPGRQSRSAGRRLLGAVSGSSSRLMRIAAYPTGASLCLAVAYMVLCTGYIILSGRVAAEGFVVGGTAALPGTAQGTGVRPGHRGRVLCFRLLSAEADRGPAAARLALLFQGVSDSLFLLQVEADAGYRFLCVNSSYLTLSGLARGQVDGKRIEEVVPESSLAGVKARYQEAIRGRRSVSWEETVNYPAGRRVGEVTLTPLADKAGRIHQLAGVIRDVTERTLAGERAASYARKLRTLSRKLVEVQETERRKLARELHDEIGQSLTVAQ